MTALPEAEGTPLTDAYENEVAEGGCLPDCNSFGHNEKCPVCNPDFLLADFARTLERKLNLAVEALRSALPYLEHQYSNLDVARNEPAVKRLHANIERGRAALATIEQEK